MQKDFKSLWKLMIHNIDVTSPDLTNVESMMITAMLEKREEYIRQGRKKEAHGAGTIIWMYWKYIHAFPDTYFK